MEARALIKPKFQLLRLEDSIIIKRDNLLLKMQLNVVQGNIVILNLIKLLWRKKTLNSISNKNRGQKSYCIYDDQAQQRKDLFGVFGYIELPVSNYLILIEECTIIGQLLRSHIFRVEKLLFMPISSKVTSQYLKSINPAYRPKEDKQFIDMIQKIVQEKAFYFSYALDLTKSIQTNIQEAMQGSVIAGTAQTVNKQNELQSLYPNSVGYIPKFAFNHYLLKEFEAIQYTAFRVPVIFGYIFIRSLHYEQNKFDFALISKKDCRRPGRRFITRGLDREGNAANFVTTEHVITLYESTGLKIGSYMQTRGSIPLIWSQKPTMKWSPSVKINPNTDESMAAAQRHIKESKDQFGDHVLINLIDKKGSQLRIGTQFTNLINQMKDDKMFYVWFDFHHECRKMKWENLAKLINLIRDKMGGFDFFLATMEVGMDQREKLGQPNTVKILQKQLGTIRTNCMDCLDRTNVVQSVISRQVAHKQLFKMGIQGPPRGDPFEVFYGLLEDSFREAWTNNANVISTLYTGTPALKTDFTRTGKRTYKGMIDDGINAVTRYYINNFCDGYYHDCLDISLGKLTPSNKLAPRGFLTPLKVTLILFGVGLYLLRGFMDTYLPAVDNKSYLLHIIVYVFSFFAGVQQIFSKIEWGVILYRQWGQVY